MKSRERDIEALPGKLREALHLIDDDDLSYEKAAKVCGVPIGTIKSRIHRARRRLAFAREARNDEELKRGPEHESMKTGSP